MYSTITSKLGVWVSTTTHAERADARKAAQDAIAAGTADSAAIWDGYQPVEHLGSGR